MEIEATVKIKVKGVEIDLTLSEARKLFDRLGDIVQKETRVYLPYSRPYPYWGSNDGGRTSWGIDVTRYSGNTTTIEI